MEISLSRQKVRFFLRLFLIASIVIVLDQGIGSLLEYFYFRQKYGERSRITYAIDSTYAQILIFGSSRAVNGYVPEIFEARLQSTCFNAGRYGSDILYNYAIFKQITQRYNPKLVLFDIYPEEIGYTSTEYERLSVLLPYYSKYPEVRDIVNQRGQFEKIKHSSAIYFYNSLILQIIAGNLAYSNRIAPDIKGHIPQTKIMKNVPLDTSRIDSYIFDQTKIKILKKLIEDCKQSNIDLVFVYSPIWSIIQDNKYETLIKNICAENDIRFFDMSNHSSFIKYPNQFSDKIHLNSEGAKIFSTILSDSLVHTR